MSFSWHARHGVAEFGAKAGETWLFVVPHDDDAVIGAGLAVAAGVQARCNVTVAITTDGRLGYCDDHERKNIAEIREAETREALNALGNPDCRFLSFPDGDLFTRRGRSLSSDAPNGGLQGAYTALLREVRPDRLFLCSNSDLHPDHKIVYEELIISLFHATGDIWPELGKTLAEVPQIFEYPIYCALSGEPDYCLAADKEGFGAKLAAIAAYQSQRQISALLDKVRSGGGYEFFRRIRFDLYDPHDYLALFPGIGDSR
ncbi:PIG-L deacetylase family protein [Sediminispirochaeta bajacaliforniensis]|uniref:PIG-L deacetylase family protein n=1 Tax=Sediminispirochaeta bajacaliforniensis TaxID=148 RepID=UPI000374BCE7|nr:PIG-L family deacetylase [Sediminispirochaeta bajacaliforniensis]